MLSIFFKTNFNSSEWQKGGLHRNTTRKTVFDIARNLSTEKNTLLTKVADSEGRKRQTFFIQGLQQTEDDFLTLKFRRPKT